MITTSVTASSGEAQQVLGRRRHGSVEQRPDRAAARRRALRVEPVGGPPPRGVDRDERQVDQEQRSGADGGHLERLPRAPPDDPVTDERHDEERRVELEPTADGERERGRQRTSRPPQIEARDGGRDREQIPVVKRVQHEDRRGRPVDRAHAGHPPQEPGRGARACREQDHGDDEVGGAARGRPPGRPHEDAREHRVLVEAVRAGRPAQRRVDVGEDVAVDPPAGVEQLDVGVAEA